MNRSETFEVNRHTYNRMVEDIASLKNHCRSLEHENHALKKEIKELAARNKRLAWEEAATKAKLHKQQKYLTSIKAAVTQEIEMHTADIERVIASKRGKKPVVATFFTDGSKAVVKCNDEDTYSVFTGVALCVCKRLLPQHLYSKFFVACDYQVEEVPDKTAKAKTSGTARKKSAAVS